MAEIRDRSHALPRHARTLLVLADGTRSADQLLSMVQGASAADLTLLVEGGLLAEAGRSRAAAAPPPAAEAPAAPAAAGEGLGYRELYDSLNALSKEQLGLFKGYRFALEIEKASGVEELRQVAQHLVEEVERVKGESAAQMVRRALGLKR
ncbi:hypothetical protein [Piscinibacter sp.]|uniref:hypothetical protein n=1 Tax=Piscinibacter sp. TaxID=1903157 RepID=UPI0039E35894